MTNKPKLLYVAEAMGGGVFTYLVELSNSLCSDFDIYIAYGLRKQTPSDYKKYFNKNVHLIKVKHFTRSISPVKDLKAFFEIKKIAKQVKPDIIHLNSSKAGVLGKNAFNGNKTPLFYTPHGFSFLMKDQSSIKRTIYRVIEKVSAMRPGTIVACSKGEYQEALKLTPHATYINNGINILQLQNLIDNVQNKVKKSKNLKVFTLGRISYQKNPTQFNKIALALPNVHFTWIGDGELKSQLTASNITVTGWLSREDALVKAMESDIFLLTSLWEGLPMSLLEAMYMKKLCIVSDVIGNHDVIHNGINGFVCNSVENFVDAINKKDFSIQIVNAHRDVVKFYNTENMVKSYKELYLKSDKSVTYEKF